MGGFYGFIMQKVAEAIRQGVTPERMAQWLEAGVGYCFDTNRLERRNMKMDSQGRYSDKCDGYCFSYVDENSDPMDMKVELLAHNVLKFAMATYECDLCKMVREILADVEIRTDFYCPEMGSGNITHMEYLRRLRDGDPVPGSSEWKGTNASGGPNLSWAYQTLYLRPDAPMSVVKASYRNLAKQHHPDRCTSGDAEEHIKAEEYIKELNRAYECIKESRT